MENVNAIEEKKEEVSTTVQYIVVKIGNEQYGINIKYIDNIVESRILQEYLRLSIIIRE